MPAENVLIRVHNAGTVNFDQVTIFFPEHKEVYGAVPPGSSSDYRTIPFAYRYAHVEILADGSTFVLRPIDYTGEKPLSAGCYTYQLTIVKEQIVLELLTE